MKTDLENGTGERTRLISRREFMQAAAAIGGAGFLSKGMMRMSVHQSAIEIDRWRSEMESPIELVRRFCAAWGDNLSATELAAFFTDDAMYHNIPLAPVTGRKAIENNFATFIRPGAPGIETLELRLVNIAANGPVVLTERVDRFTMPDKSFELPVMGTFEISGGKIKAWRDYFDMNQFATRSGIR